jgi:hypothetical protein
MRALSIRQPFAELILRGIKRIEYRSRPTRIIGERFYIYASKGSAFRGQGSVKTWSSDLSVVNVPPWMIDLANALRLFPHELPTGVIVGSAVIERCERMEEEKSRMEDGGSRIEDGESRMEKSVIVHSPSSTLHRPSSIFHPPSSLLHPPSMYMWHLADVQRAKKFRKPKGHPQPVWFSPF